MTQFNDRVRQCPDCERADRESRRDSRSEEAAGAGETRSHSVLVTAALGPVQRNTALSSAGRNTDGGFGNSVLLLRHYLDLIFNQFIVVKINYAN